MNTLWHVLVYATLLALALVGRAEDTAPTSISGKTAVVVISNGTGNFAPIGGYRISFSPTNSTYTITPLSYTVIPAAGTYTYSKTGPNTGKISIVDSAVGAAAAQTLVFTSAATATYSLTSSFGSQSGTVVWENVTTSAAVGTGLVNMSVRAVVPNGSQVIPGLVLDSPARVLVRVAGPALAAFGVSGTLPNPKLTVMSGATTIASNDDWSSTTANQTIVADAAAKTGAFALSVGSKDAATVIDLNAGSYTCVITGDPGTSGEVILEVYRVP